jgi:hypothetical protein
MMMDIGINNKGVPQVGERPYSCNHYGLINN